MTNTTPDQMVRDIFHDDLSNKDFLIATSYAWGRSDEGAKHNANEIYEFGLEWATLKRDFREGKSGGGITSLVSFYERFFRSREVRYCKVHEVEHYTGSESANCRIEIRSI